MKKLNIVLAATGTTSLANDFYIAEISKRLRQRGHKVWVIKVNPEKQFLEKYDIPIYWSGPRWKWIWIFYLACPYLKVRSLSKAVAKGINTIKEKIDVVDLESATFSHCYQKKGNEVIVVRAWYYPHDFWKRIKIMWPVGPKGIISKIIFMLRQAWFHWSGEWGYKKADSIITLTPQLARQLKGFGFKATWVPLGIKVKKYRKQPTRVPVKFGAVAYDLENPRKGIKYLLEAVKILTKMDLPQDSYKIELIGGYTKKLKEEIKKSGLEKRIVLLGRIEHNKIMTKLQQWDVFTFPTLFEELSLATIEAIAAGLVCVGWKIDALEAAWGNAGILLPKENVEQLAETMCKLITNPELRIKLSQEAWQRAKKYFSWKVVVSRLERVYEMTIKEKRLHSVS